ncbi:YigZ family protein [Oceanobacillus kapialis]|uniref:YigZ family protein n=1 Tax=Oceanobacillus kapialis TaxID=481353 RepID=A0ABW5Q0K6_9BACI
MLATYFTVKQTGIEEIVIQKSRFIGHVARVETEEAAQQFIQEIKKKHAAATHNCSAYMIGEHDQIQKANDDGEPSGTAGVPILEVLKKKNLKDTVVVVTRYFGGIKLGAGGLIRAYGNATTEALRGSGIVERQLMQGMSVTVDYTLLGKLENVLRQSNYILETINYMDKVEFIVFVKTGEEDSFQDWMIDLTSDQAKITKSEKKYMEKDVPS